MGGLGGSLVRISDQTMYLYFDIDGFSIQRLLSEWRWLAPGNFRLVAVSAFGELFLQDDLGAIHWLDTSIGNLTRIGESLEQFKDSLQIRSRRNEWFAEEVELSLAGQGFCPSKGQCFGYKTPIVFSESTGAATNVYIADLYEYVSFLGDLHFQIKNVPDGGKVRLIVKEKPKCADLQSKIGS